MTTTTSAPTPAAQPPVAVDVVDGQEPGKTQAARKKLHELRVALLRAAARFGLRYDAVQASRASPYIRTSTRTRTCPLVSEFKTILDKNGSAVISCHVCKGLQLISARTTGDPTACPCPSF